MVIRQ